MSAGFQYDVFLSHNSADKPRVWRLAERLRADGLKVWFDEWVLKPGDNIYLAIERGLEAARVQVLCLSPATLESDWAGLERSAVGRGNLLFRNLANAGRRFDRSPRQVPVSPRPLNRHNSGVVAALIRTRLTGIACAAILAAF